MRILHVAFIYGDNATGGAAIAATRLHNTLLDDGIDSWFVCVMQRQGGKNVIQIPKEGSLKRSFFLFTTKLLRNVWRYSSIKQKESINFIPSGLGAVVSNLHPDLVQLHGIGADSFSFEEISKLKVPVLGTLHDFNLINGFAPYPYDDCRLFNGFTTQNSSKLERWVWLRKKKMAETLNMSFVGPSDWVVDQARKSVIAKMHEVYMLPNIISSIYSYDASLRKKHSKFTLIFGCNGGINNEFKGFDDLKSTLLLLTPEEQRHIKLLVFGDVCDNFKIGEVEVEVCGIISAAADLKVLYHQGDVFAFPSKTETQGMVKVEAWLCGLPVIAFNRTACGENIKNKENGWCCESIQDFADGIRYYMQQFISNNLNDCFPKISSWAEQNYSKESILRKAKDIYNKILKTK